MTIHAQTRIEHEGRTADVDVGIAPLILELWRAGLWTLMSCQDNDGRGGDGNYVWVQFVRASALEEFLRLVFTVRDTDIESMYNRAVGGIEPADWEAFRDNRAWRYRAEPREFNEDRGDTAATDIWLTGDVWFPRSDVDEVLARLRQRNGTSG